MNLIIFASFWVQGTLENILISIVSISHFGKRLWAQGMTILGSHVGTHILNRMRSC